MNNADVRYCACGCGKTFVPRDQRHAMRLPCWKAAQEAKKAQAAEDSAKNIKAEKALADMRAKRNLERLEADIKSGIWLEPDSRGYQNIVNNPVVKSFQKNGFIATIIIEDERGKRSLTSHMPAWQKSAIQKAAAAVTAENLRKIEAAQAAERRVVAEAKRKAEANKAEADKAKKAVAKKTGKKGK